MNIGDVIKDNANWFFVPIHFFAIHMNFMDCMPIAIRVDVFDDTVTPTFDIHRCPSGFDKGILALIFN
jgi:hypothetical protein